MEAASSDPEIVATPEPTESTSTTSSLDPQSDPKPTEEPTLPPGPTPPDYDGFCHRFNRDCYGCIDAGCYLCENTGRCFEPNPVLVPGNCGLINTTEKQCARSDWGGFWWGGSLHFLWSFMFILMIIALLAMCLMGSRRRARAAHAHNQPRAQPLPAQYVSPPAPHVNNATSPPQFVVLAPGNGADGAPGNVQIYTQAPLYQPVGQQGQQGFQTQAAGGYVVHPQNIQPQPQPYVQPPQNQPQPQQWQHQQQPR